MNSEQKALVQSSFRAVLGLSDLVSDLFYRRLFLLDPSLKPMFRGDIQQQGQKLISVLRVCVLGLDNLDQLIPTVEALGKRHVGYGVKDEHYDTVATALLWAMQQGLGDAFTPAVAAAWVEVYTILASVMKAAAAAQVEETQALRATASRRVSYASVHFSQPAPASSRLVPPHRCACPRPPPRASRRPPPRASRRPRRCACPRPPPRASRRPPPRACPRPLRRACPAPRRCAQRSPSIQISQSNRQRPKRRSVPCPGPKTHPHQSGAQSRRRRVQRGVFGAETYSSTLSTENVAMGPYPPRLSPALRGRGRSGGCLRDRALVWPPAIP